MRAGVTDSRFHHKAPVSLRLSKSSNQPIGACGVCDRRYGGTEALSAQSTAREFALQPRAATLLIVLPRHHDLFQGCGIGAELCAS